MKPKLHSRLPISLLLSCSIASAATDLITPTAVTYTTLPNQEEPSAGLNDESNLIDAVGMTQGGVAANPTFANYLTIEQGPAAVNNNAWATTAPGGDLTDFFAQPTSTPQTFVFDLGGSYAVDGFVMWGYHFGVYNGNQAKGWTLEFSTDGGLTYGSPVNIVLPYDTVNNRRSAETSFAARNANFIRATVTDNHFGSVINGNTVPGGDRVGIAEIRMLGTPGFAPARSYWDTDGITAGGGGGTTPTGTWNASTPNWSSSADGNVLTDVWQSGFNAVFAAGTGATGAYTVTVAGTQSVAGIEAGEGQITLNGGSIALQGAASLNTETGAQLIIQSALTGTNGLNTAGTGSLTLSGINTYSGVTKISSPVTIANGAAVPDGSLLDIRSSGELTVTGLETAGGVSGTGLLRIPTSQTLVLNPASNQSHSGSLDGAGTVRKTGAFTQTLGGGTLKFAGVVEVNAGTLSPGGANAFGNAPVSISPGAAVDLAGASHSAAGLWRLAGTGSTGSALTNTGGGAILTANLQLTGDTTIGGTGAISIGTQLVPSTLTDAATGSRLTKIGTGNVWVRGAGAGSTIAGVIVNEGQFGVEATDNALSGVPIRVNAGAVLTSWGSTQTVPTTQNNPISLNGGSLSSTLTTATQTYTGSIALLADSFLSDAANGGSFVVGGAITGNFGVTKRSANTVTLTGGSTYSGPTLVNAGSLVVEGSLGATAVSVASGASLAGGGTLAGPVHILTGGKIEITGDAAADLGTGDLTLDADAQTAFKFDSTNGAAQRIAATGNVVLGGLPTFTDLAASPVVVPAGTVLTFITSSGSLSGQFTGIANGGIVTIGLQDFTAHYTPTSFNLTPRVLVPPSYTNWAQQYLLSGADAEVTADLDLDGWTNLQEFLFGGNPKSPDISQISIRLQNGTATITWLGRAVDSGAQYSVARNTALSGTWTDVGVTPSPAADQSNVPSGYVRYSVVVPRAEAKNFYRVIGLEP